MERLDYMTHCVLLFVFTVNMSGVCMGHGIYGIMDGEKDAMLSGWL